MPDLVGTSMIAELTINPMDDVIYYDIELAHGFTMQMKLYFHLGSCRTVPTGPKNAKEFKEKKD